MFLINPYIYATDAWENQKSISMDGVDEYVDLGNITMLNNTGTFSVSMWVKCPHSAANATFFSKFNDANLIVDNVLTTFGSVDLLINNAGVQVEKTLMDSTDNDWDLVVGVNCRGVFNMSRACLPSMQKKGGNIINIGSISGKVSDPSMALYNASKAFVHGLTRSIAVDHGPMVRCNAIQPGWIMTAMADEAFAQADDPELSKQDALARHPVGRFGKPEDIANMVSFLASENSHYLSGECITVDGGLTAASPLRPGLF